MRLPTFLIIGAHKGGTTSLHAYLQEHPDVFMTGVLEPCFFALQGQSRRNPDGTPSRPLLQAQGAAYTWPEYVDLFRDARDERAIGEKSPIYLPNPQAPFRIKEYLPDVRLIAVLRQPVDRAFSHYCMNAGGGIEKLPFDEAIKAELAGQPARPGVVRHYLRTGFYADGVARYKQLFPPEQLRFYLYDDLAADTPGVVADIFRYIGVDPTFAPRTDVRHNARRSPPSRPFKSRARSHVVTGVRRVVRGERRPRPTTAVSAATRRRLLNTYRPDIQRLEELLGRDLSAWLSE